MEMMIRPSPSLACAESASVVRLLQPMTPVRVCDLVYLRRDNEWSCVYNCVVVSLLVLWGVEVEGEK